MLSALLNAYVTVNTTRRRYEVADVFRQYWRAYEATYWVTWEQARVAQAIMACRTAALGGRWDQCNECGHWRLSFNSCKNRHCPKCGSYEKAQWLAKQAGQWLPTGYYHGVFTVAHEFNGLIWRNKRALYDLMFDASSGVVKAYGQKYLGGQVGDTAVLHTWGQQLEAHPHTHHMITGGALVEEAAGRLRWQSSGRDFLFPVVALAADYRERFCEGVLRLWRGGQLEVRAGEDVGELVERARAKRWEVYLSPAPPQAEILQEYLSRYIYRIAISNHRLERVDERGVTFRYRDNRDGGKEKLRSLSGVEFLRRFLLHVLPRRYVRVRQYGLHHSSQRGRLEASRALLGGVKAAEVKLTLATWLEQIGVADGGQGCPACGRGRMIPVLEFGRLPGVTMWLWLLLGLRLEGVLRRREKKPGPGGEG